MRYLVKARVKPGREKALLKAIADGSLGQGSVAGDEYQHNMQQARVAPNGIAHWVETCFCATPLDEANHLQHDHDGDGNDNKALNGIDCYPMQKSREGGCRPGLLHCPRNGVGRPVAGEFVHQPHEPVPDKWAEREPQPRKVVAHRAEPARPRGSSSGIPNPFDHRLRLPWKNGGRDESRWPVAAP